MKGGVVAVIAILAVFSLVVRPGRAVSCPQVNAALAPCITYLTGHEGPSEACCAGVKAVKGMAKTAADKRSCCGCIKESANRYSDLKDDVAKGLPAKCGVQMDIPVSRTVDCSKIN